MDEGHYSDRTLLVFGLALVLLALSFAMGVASWLLASDTLALVGLAMAGVGASAFICVERSIKQ